MEQLREWWGAPASRSGSLWLVVVPLAAVVTLATIALPGALVLAAPIALAAALAVVLQPLFGLAAVVFGSQVGGLIERLVPGPGDWLLEALAGLVLVGVAISSFREAREQRWGPDVPGIRAVALFAIVIAVSCLLADNVELARTGLRKMLSLMLLLYLIVRLCRSRRHLRVLVLAVVVSTALSGAVGVAGYLRGKPLVVSDERYASPDSDRVRTAGASSDDATAASRPLLAGSAVALVLALRDRKRRWLHGTCALLGLAGVVLTFSRSTSLVLLLALFWLGWKFVRHRRFPQVLAAATVLVAIGLALVPHGYWQRLSTLSSPGEDWTLSRRLGYHLIGFDLLRQHPILGVGPDNYRERYLDYKYRAMPGRRLEARAMHNMYLSVAVENGLLGFACFAAILIVALHGLARVRARAPDSELGWLAEAVHFALVVYLVTCLFGAAETSKYLWILTGLAMALARVALPRSECNPAAG